MIINDFLKNKVIIIAENNTNLAKDISFHLKEQGLNNIKFAQDGSKVYEILRLYYDEPEKIGLIIVNENLPQCHVSQMCKTLSSNDDHSIPFIILGIRENKELAKSSFDLETHYLNRYIPLPINFSEFLIIIEFQLMMKNERSLRHQQESRVINELAERKVIDAKLKYLVIHDELTGLLNRQNFDRQLRLILNRSKLLNSYAALLFVDIDRFSIINELEGFEAGDKLLVDVVSLIRNMLSPNDLFARIGSDEFCIFLENKAEKDLKQFANKIKDTVYNFRFFTSNVSYSTSLSIGIANFNNSKTISHPGEIIFRARQACNMAKSNGRNLVWEYNENDSSVHQRNHDISLAPLIRNSLLNNRFFLVFQPVVDLNNGDISHYETLIRMRDESGNTLYPNDFIPVAERMGLIHSIDLWVVSEAIDFLAGLERSRAHLSLAINLSGFAFQDKSLLPAIKEKLELTWVNAKRITFEITETAAVENFEQTRDMILQIRALGCKFALDDFGAGFCSFNYLKSFPVDYVKIDGQFIRNLINDETDQVLVRSMAEIAKKLGKKTIAEFVESAEIIVILKEMGIDFGQGYVFGKPETSILASNSISISDLIYNARKTSNNPIFINND
ncbi:MAG: EAL domain-containing protein [Methylococcales bacterium]